MNKSLEQEIFALEWRIENLAEQEGATRADCIAEFAIKKRNPNCKAVLGVAWHCLERALPIYMLLNAYSPIFLRNTTCHILMHQKSSFAEKKLSDKPRYPDLEFMR